MSSVRFSPYPRRSIRLATRSGGGPGGDPSRVMRLIQRGRAARRMALSGRRASATMVTRNRGATSGYGVTQQHDARLVYAKRNMSRGKKRRWRKFKNKVLAVSEKGLGSQTVVFNVQTSRENTDPTLQAVEDFALYPMVSGSATWFNDLDRIGQLNAAAATTPDSGLTVSQSSKILFKSAILDMTIRNTSTNNGSFDSSLRLEVDVYEIVMYSNGDEEGTTYGRLLDLFNQNSVRTLPIGGGVTSKVDFNRRGVTPFELTYSLSNWKIKILRKTKYQINAGDQITYQIRDPRRHVMLQRQLTSTEGFNNPKCTRLVYITGKLAPGITVGPVGTPGVCQERMTFGVTRKYFYKVENWSEDRTAYVNA